MSSSYPGGGMFLDMWDESRDRGPMLDWHQHAYKFKAVYIILHLGFFPGKLKEETVALTQSWNLLQLAHIQKEI